MQLWFEVVLVNASVVDLFETKLTFHDSGGMLHVYRAVMLKAKSGSRDMDRHVSPVIRKPKPEAGPHASTPNPSPRPPQRLQRDGGNRLITCLRQLHVTAASGFRQVFAHAAADELALGVDHQEP